MHQVGDDLRPPYRVLIGRRMPGLDQSDSTQGLGLWDLSVPVFGDYRAGSQVLAQRVCYGGGHRHGGFAKADDEHALVRAESVAATRDDEHISLAIDMPVHSGPRIDGGQCCVLQFLSVGVQVSTRHIFISPVSPSRCQPLSLESPVLSGLSPVPPA